MQSSSIPDMPGLLPDDPGPRGSLAQSTMFNRVGNAPRASYPAHNARGGAQRLNIGCYEHEAPSTMFNRV